MRVLLVDDHELVRAGLHALLAGLPDVTEVVEAADGREAVAAAARYRPDVVLMDITMPRMNGLEATARIVKEFPTTPVIILSMHRGEQFVWDALRAGARGYLVKAGAASELQSALRAVQCGLTYVSPSVRRIANDELPEAAGELAGELREKRSPLEQLTPRQREVLQLIVEGSSNRQIAALLGIHVKTVDSHRTQLMKRLAIHDVAGLVHYAIRNGLTPKRVAGQWPRNSGGGARGLGCLRVDRNAGARASLRGQRDDHRH